MIDLNHPRILKALAFATAAHAAVGQRRKYTGEPYIVHPWRLAVRASKLPGVTIDMIVALILHDTVEDTRAFLDPEGNVVADPAKYIKKRIPLTLREGITLDLIEQQFGAEVRRIVAGLTDVAMPWDGNRKVRSKINRDHTFAQEADVHTCKLIDSEDNIRDIIVNDPNFAVVYVREKADLIVGLKNGNAEVYASFQAMIDNYKKAA